MAEIDFNYETAEKVRKDLVSGQEQAAALASQMVTLADSLEVAWSDERSAAVLNYLRDCATAYDSIVDSIQLTLNRLEKTKQLITQARARQFEERWSAEHPQQEPTSEQLRWREQLEQESKFGPKYPPWQATVH